MPQPKGNGFTEFDNDRGLVERLLVPFRGLADTIEDPQISAGGPPPVPAPDKDDGPYSRWDIFGYHPKQHEGFMEALWESFRMWQLKGYPEDQTVFRGYRPKIVNRADVPGRGKETWTPPQKNGPATVTFENTLKSYLTNLGFGVPRTDSSFFLQPERYERATTWLLQDLANCSFVPTYRKKEEQRFYPARFWHHLFYAFAIEATNVVAIWKKLIQIATTSEDLDFFHPPSQRWMRATESLWKMSRGVSEIVNDGTGRLRRNAYYRMFGLDIDKVLSKEDIPFERPEGANVGFVPVFEDLLYEVWQAYTNRDNTSGANTTDPVAIIEICRSLRDMLRDRRIEGTLTQVEYAAVAEMSWYYLPLDGDSPIVQDMRSQASEPDERLRRVGDGVGVPAHPKTRSLLKLAERVSLLLIEIEQGDYDDGDRVQMLYKGGETTKDMLDIINEWSILVGRDMKATRTAPQGRFPNAKPTPLLGR